MTWRDEMAEVFAPTGAALDEIAADLAACRRGMEACRTADISLQRAFAARLEAIAEELDQ